MISIKGRLEHLHKLTPCDCHVDGRGGVTGLHLYGPDEANHPLDILVVVCNETLEAIQGAAAFTGEDGWDAR